MQRRKECKKRLPHLSPSAPSAFVHGYMRKPQDQSNDNQILELTRYSFNPPHVVVSFASGDTAVTTSPTAKVAVRKWSGELQYPPDPVASDANLASPSRSCTTLSGESSASVSPDIIIMPMTLFVRSVPAGSPITVHGIAASRYHPVAVTLLAEETNASARSPSSSACPLGPRTAVGES